MIFNMTKIKLLIPSGQAKSGPPLAPILGQHQVNLVEFCKLFNAKTNDQYSLNVPVRLKLYKQKTNVTYKYEPITFSSLMKNFVFYTNKDKFLYFSQCYDILVVRVAELERYQKINKKIVAKQLFGFLKSSKITIRRN